MNLEQIQNKIKHIAKNNKGVRYSKALVINFLMGGMLLQAAPEDNLVKASNEIGNKINEQRKENKKKLNVSRLELLNLEDQGNHVVKSPWSSWQFSIGYVYDEGKKVDEDKQIKYTRDSWWIANVPVNSNQWNSLGTTTSGTVASSTPSTINEGLISGVTELKKVDKPLSKIEISATINPKEVKTKNIDNIVVVEPVINLNPVTAPNLLSPTVNSIPGITTPIQPNPNINVNVNPSIIVNTSFVTPTGISFSFQAGHNAGAPPGPLAGEPGYQAQVPGGTDLQSSGVSYASNFGGRTDILSGGTSPTHNFYASATTGGASKAVASDVVLKSRNQKLGNGFFFFENSPSAVMFAFLGKITIQPDSETNYVVGDTVDGSALSTTYNGGLMEIFAAQTHKNLTIATDKPSGGGALMFIPTTVNEASSTSAGSNSNKFLINDGTIHIKGFGNYGIININMDHTVSGYGTAAHNANRPGTLGDKFIPQTNGNVDINIILNRNEVVIEKTQGANYFDSQFGNVGLSAYAQEKALEPNSGNQLKEYRGMIFDNTSFMYNEGSIRSLNGNNMLMQHKGSGQMINNGVLEIFSDNTIGMIRENIGHRGYSVITSATNISHTKWDASNTLARGTNDGVINITTAATNVLGLKGMGYDGNGIVDKVNKVGGVSTGAQIYLTYDADSKVVVQNGDGNVNGYDIDENGVATDSHILNIDREDRYAAGKDIFNLVPGLKETLDEDKVTTYILDGTTYTTRDGVIFIGGKNSAGMYVETQNALSKQEGFSGNGITNYNVAALPHINNIGNAKAVNNTDGKIYLYATGNGVGQHTIGMAGKYATLENKGKIYLGLLPDTSAIGATTKNGAATAQEKYIGIFGQGSNVTNVGDISDKATNNNINYSKNAFGIFVNSETITGGVGGAITNSGNITLGEGGKGLFGLGLLGSRIVVNTSGNINVTGSAANIALGVIGEFSNTNINNSTITLSGENALGASFDNSDVELTNLVVTEAGGAVKDSFGVAIKGANGNTLKLNNGNKVTLTGNNNVGIYGKNLSYIDASTTLAQAVDITLGTNGVGIFLDNVQNDTTVKAKQITTGEATGGKLSGGIYAKSATNEIGVEAGNITIGTNAAITNQEAFGVYVSAKSGNTKKVQVGNVVANFTEGTGVFAENVKDVQVGNVTAGKNGIYHVNTATAGTLQANDITLTGAVDNMVGIASGKVTGGVPSNYVGVTLNKLETTGVAGNNFVGIYVPNGTLNVTDKISISSGDSSVGLYVKNVTGTTPTLNLGAGASSITLGDNTSVGVYLENVKVNNMLNGTITVGSTGTSGIYAENVEFINPIATNVVGGTNSVGAYFGLNTTGAGGVALQYSGNITVGGGSTGLYKTGGTIQKAGASQIIVTGTDSASVGVYLDNSVLDIIGAVNATTLQMNSGIAFLLKGTNAEVRVNGVVITTADLDNLGLAPDVERFVYSDKTQTMTEDILLSSVLRTKGHRALNGRIDLNANINTDSSNPVTGSYGVLADGRYTSVPVNEDVYLHLGKTIDMTNSIASVGIEVLNGARAKSDGTIVVGQASTQGVGIGMYGEGNGLLSTSLENNGDTKLSSNKGIGIYLSKAELGGTVTNAGNIINTGAQEETIGIYAIATAPGAKPTITNSGAIRLGNGSLGIYANNGNIMNTGSIEVGNRLTERSLGIYADKGSLVNSNGDVKVGLDGIGFYIDNSQLNITGGTFDISNGGILAYGSNGSTVNYQSGGINSSTTTNPVFYIVGGSTLNLTGSAGDIIANSNSVGIYLSNSNLIGDTRLKLGNNSVGVYSDTPTGGVLNITAGSSIETLPGVTTEAKGIAVLKGNVLNQGLIRLSGEKSVGIYANNTSGVPTSYVTNSNLIDMTGDKSIGIFTKGIDRVTNTGIINVGASSLDTNPSIGIFTDAGAINSHNGEIQVGASSIGIYSQNTGATTDFVNNKLSVNDNGIGVYSKGVVVQIDGASKVTVKDNGAVGVYGVSTNISTSAETKVGNGSFGYTLMGGGSFANNSVLTSEIGNESIYVYSVDTATITNNGNINTIVGSLGDSTAIYAKNGSTIVNTGKLDLSRGKGNIGIYGEGGSITSSMGDISVGGSLEKIDATGVSKTYNSIGIAGINTTINNSSNIYLSGNNAIGVYGAGAGTTVTNTGNIYFDASSATSTNKIDRMMGIYLADGAVGYNHGTITTSGDYRGNADVTGIIGIAVTGGSTFVNEASGRIIINSDNAIGMYVNGGIIKNYGEITIKGANTVGVRYDATATVENSGGTIWGDRADTELIDESQGKEGIPGIEFTKDGQIIRDGENNVTPNPNDIINSLNDPQSNNVVFSNVGIYVDTLGRTNPIKTDGPGFSSGGENLLLIGAEAGEETNSKEMLIGANILKKFNNSIAAIANFEVESGSLTWSAYPVKGPNGLDHVLMAKIDYNTFANDGDIDTYNFADGLEQRYGMNALGSREKELFNKLNDIGNNEHALLSQAFNNMKGHQYANVQKRIMSSGSLIDTAVNDLFGWETESKQSNKVKAIGGMTKHETETAGIHGYKQESGGIVYLNQHETVKLGDSQGWYGGLLYDRFKLDDYGKSREDVVTAKIGLYKSIAFDDNNSLNWTIKGDVSGAYHKMHRKYLVVDDMFNAKGNYYSYGVNVKNELSKMFRLSKGIKVGPVASLNLEYGRFTDIKEKTGEMRLEVKGNDYYSIKPGIGAKISFDKKVFSGLTFKAELEGVVEAELGETTNVENKVRVRDTTADYYKLRKEDKEEVLGRAGLSLELGNDRIGFTINGSYDTEEEVKAGVGIRYIF